MDIEYLFSFKEQFFSSPMVAVKIFLFLGIAKCTYLLIKRCKTVVHFTLSLLAGFVAYGGLFYWEYSNFNQKFSKLSYSPDRVVLYRNVLYRKKAEKFEIKPKDVERFWSISVGRNGGWSCYLLIKTADRDYESLTVRKRQHSCKADADRLNRFYRKS